MRSFFKAIALILPLALAFGCGESPREYTGVDIGQRYVSEYKFEQALQQHQAALEADPADAAAVTGIGLYYEAQLMYFNAFNSYAAALESGPDFAPAWLGLSRIYRLIGDPAYAADAATEAIKYSKDKSAARLYLALAHLDRDAAGQALGAISDAADDGLSSEIVNLVKARALSMQGKYEEAVSLFDSEISDLNGSRQFELAAEAAEEFGWVDSAITLSGSAVESSGNDCLTINTHFFRCLRNGYFAEAREAIELIHERDETASLRAAMDVYFWVAEGGRTNQMSYANYLISLLPNDVDSRLMMMKAEAASATTGGLIQERALIHSMMEQAGWTEEVRNYMLYWLALELVGDIPERESVWDFGRIPAEFNNRREVRIKGAMLKREVGWQDQFDEDVEDILKTRQAQADWITDIAALYYTMGETDYDKAEELLVKALELDRNYAPAFVHMVGVQRARKSQQGALGLFEEYSHFKDFPLETQKLYATCLAEDRQYEKAVESLESIAPKFRRDLRPFRDLAETLRQNGQYPLVSRMAAKLAELNGDHAPSLALAAHLYLDAGELDKASALADAATDLDSELLEVQAARARTLMAAGEVADGLDLFKEVYAKDRQNRRINTYYAIALNEADTMALTAANLARQSFFDEPSNLRNWMAMCQAYLNDGRPDLCRGEALKANNFHYQAAEPKYYAGLALHAEGKPEGKEFLKQALEIGLYGKQRQKAEGVLNQ